MTLAELLGIDQPAAPPAARTPPPAVRPHQPDPDDEPADVQAEARPRGNSQADGVPADGRQLLGWLKPRGRDAMRDAVTLAKSRGYGTMLIKLSADQVADIYHELTAAGPGPRRGQKWGG